jgi:type VI secretion system protein ImpK
MTTEQAIFIAHPVEAPPAKTSLMDVPAATDPWELLQQIPHHSGLNVLLEQATEIFVIHYYLLHGQLQNLERLRLSIEEALSKFELRALAQNFSKTLIKSAKYIFCTFLDEVIMAQEFASESSWSQHSLLSKFFNETWGGATVFKIHQFCLEHLPEYLDLLELIYLVLCLGFKGQFGSLPQGEVQLERLKRETYQVIMDLRVDSVHLPLSPQARSDYDGHLTLKPPPKIFGLMVVAGMVLLCAYVVLSLFLSIASAPLFHQLVAFMHPGL